MECLVLGDLLREPSLCWPSVGVPTIPLAVEQLNAARQRDAAVIIWLQADPDELASRLESSTGDRPSLTGRTPAEEIAEISGEGFELPDGVRHHARCRCNGGVAGCRFGSGRAPVTAAVDWMTVKLRLRCRGMIRSLGSADDLFVACD